MSRRRVAQLVRLLLAVFLASSALLGCSAYGLAPSRGAGPTPTITTHVGAGYDAPGQPSTSSAIRVSRLEMGKGLAATARGHSATAAVLSPFRVTGVAADEGVGGFNSMSIRAAEL